MIKVIAPFIAAELTTKDPKLDEVKFIARQNVKDVVVLGEDPAGVDDRKTGYGYIRYLADQDHFYDFVAEERKFKSDSRGAISVRCPLRLVICHKYENQDGYEWFIVDTLRNLILSAPGVTFDNPQIKVLSSSKDKERIFQEETGADENEITSNTVINLLSVDMEVSWNLGPCKTSNFNPNEC